MTVDQLRDHVVAALRDEAIASGRTALWIDAACEGQEPTRRDLGDAADPWLGDVWIPWMIRKGRTVAVAAAWIEKDRHEDRIRVEILSANRREAFSIGCGGEEALLPKRNERSRLFSDERTDSYRRLMRRNAMLSA